MRKIIVLLIMCFPLFAVAQEKNISTVNSVRPKMGQKMAFEAAYKQHIAKFHKGDAMISVYEIISGPNMGFYHLVNGGRSIGDFDKERADATAHGMDLDKNFFPYLDEARNLNYRFIDTLSFHTDFKAEKFVVNIRHIKSDMMEEYMKESRRSIIVLGKLKGAFWDNLAFANYTQMWSGSDRVMVNVRALKDGFASLERNFYGENPAGNPTFKDVYIQEYGTLDWDKRTKTMDNAVEKNEQYIMKLRKDLSSQ
ncbi:MAG: hypothetical protein ACO25B_02320 [Chitinophagaceae bacterium]